MCIGRHVQNERESGKKRDRSTEESRVTKFYLKLLKQMECCRLELLVTENEMKGSLGRAEILSRKGKTE